MDEFGAKFILIETRNMQGVDMKYANNIRSISYLKNNAAKISEELEGNSSPFFITQNGSATMVIESVHDYQEKEELLALLKILALGKKDALAGKGLSADDFLKELDAMDGPFSRAAA